MTTQRGHRQLPPDGRSSRASQPLPVGLAHCQPPRTTTTSPSRPSAGAQPGLRQLRAPGPNLGRRRAVMDMAGDPGHPSRAAAGPTATPRDIMPSDTADAATHGRRRPDTGLLDAQTPQRTPVTWTRTGGHRTLALDTGHWTPDAEHERGHGDDSTAGIRTSLAATPSDRMLRPNRVSALALPAGCSAPSTSPAKRRPGALLSSEDCGSSVERRAGSHPVHAGREDAYGVRCSVCWVERVAGCSGRCVKLGEVI
jgi:hypothetical protein